MYCLQQKKIATVIILGVEGENIASMPYWLTVAAAPEEGMLENAKVIFGGEGKEIRVVEKAGNL